jgi:putative transposase
MSARGFPARRIVALLGVSESGFYAWRARASSARAVRRSWLTQMILDIHRESGSVFGYRRIKRELCSRYGIDVSHRTVELLMKGAGIHGRAGPLHQPAPQGGAGVPGHRWVVDVLAWTTLQGCLYTAVVLDTTSRDLIAWSTAASARPVLLHRALMAAISRGADPEPPAGTAPGGLLACSFTTRAAALECAPVRGAAGDWYDHAVVEAFWDRVHGELHNLPSWPDAPALQDRLGQTLGRFTRQA